MKSPQTGDKLINWCEDKDIAYQETTSYVNLYETDTDARATESFPRWTIYFD